MIPLWIFAIGLVGSAVFAYILCWLYEEEEKHSE